MYVISRTFPITRIHRSCHVQRSCM